MKSTSHLPEFPALNPQELEELSREVGRKLTNEEAQKILKERRSIGGSDLEKYLRKPVSCPR